MTVLVTGAGGRFGAAVLTALRAAPGIGDVVGVDTSADRRGSADLLQVDPRTPSIARVVAEVAPAAVVHLGLVENPARAGGRAAMKERNVIGTMQLLAACQKAPYVRRLVVRSSASVYGSAPRDAALFTEDSTPHQPPRSGYGKDVAEVEGYVRGFARRRPDVAVTVLRMAPMPDAGVDLALESYLAMPVLPTVLGFDPRLQLLHRDDAVEALRLATVGAHPGTYNIAGSGVLLLSQMARRLRRPIVPLQSPGLPVVSQLLRRAGVTDLTPAQIDLLTRGRVLDTTAMRERLGLRATHSTAATFEAYLRTASGRGVLPSDHVAAGLGSLREALVARGSRRG
jgi:UDP-glucose 4-epimerase